MGDTAICRAKHIYHRNGISELKSDKGPKHIGPQCTIIEQTAELNRLEWLYGGPSLAPYMLYTECAWKMIALHPTDNSQKLWAVGRKLSNLN